MSDDVGLDEVKLVVENFAEKYDGNWSLLKAEVEREHREVRRG